MQNIIQSSTLYITILTQNLNQLKLQLLTTHKIKHFYETKVSKIAIVNGLIKQAMNHKIWPSNYQWENQIL